MKRPSETYGWVPNQLDISGQSGKSTKQTKTVAVGNNNILVTKNSGRAKTILTILT